ncbi:CDP-diacylglycerol--glycerol-3-phosphate 3-phosphatidyltransferase [Desulfitobacterium chlororespirans]|uniref:CDP-diacylglycerol--glycerol-3-phosphate 3-phosphatidyltransferase n=1 Tax=Desulfitobacterium chlororespirans DSM 11544 TaxID=1121395 RepID=A0A1M7UG40_9FIRM|nr:CDP-diacylglycerol--glycerol-3-phosphate 3-phosphatidyltransferase [Desulfitobacterium chlororespirans]SHN82001.1 CDP-diacylglycerol--glycerol-3-phosphate 3-phosphatidyltransferase [Desulfitobacterium chlororespirans DSM 11544]
MNLPNQLTMARIILIPIFMALLLIQFPKGQPIFPHQDFVAAMIFIVAAATDGLDGYIARKRGQVTVLGKFMDPLADKLLVSAALIALVDLGDVPAWICWIILAREFAVTGLRAIASADGTVIAASKLGKIKTVSQVLAISLILLHDWPLSLFNLYLGQPLLYVALFFTIVSGVDYLVKSKKLLKK